MKRYLWISLLILPCGCGNSSNRAGAPDSPQKPDDIPVVQEARCGDGIVQTGESCDGNVGVMPSCAEWDPSKQWQSGRPACAADCKSITAGTCVEVAIIPETQKCGNGIVEGDEVCDVSDGVPATCAEWDGSKNWVEGTPACTSDCKSVIAGTCRESVCGDGVAEGDEVCDGSAGIPTTCAEWDNSKTWAEGTPECSSDCKAIVAGSCREIVCGDGLVEGNEVCDTAVSLTCSEFDSQKQWADGGSAACESNCSQIAVGSCTQQFPLTVMNWNILFEYTEWGGKEVLPRAQLIHDLLAKYETKPDFIAMVEASPRWHYEDVNALLDDVGYAWAEPTVPDAEDRGSYMTQLVYLKDKFEVIDFDYVTLYPYTDEGDWRHKCVSFAAVLREKATGAEFIAMSTHWEANIESETCTYKQNLAGPIVMREQNRVKGVAQTVELIEKLRAKYPKAHIFYGGDLNTIDFNLIYESPEVSKILGDTPEKLVETVNTFYSGASEETCGDKLPEGFVGSLAEFTASSGLLNARNEALKLNVAINDVSTTNTISLGGESSEGGAALDALLDQLLNIKIVIDYAFYSPTMTLTGYEVVTGDSYAEISDHYPVRTTYLYSIPK